MKTRASVYQKTREVYNKLGKQYIKDSERLYPVERKSFAKFFPKNSRILDVGCAGGRDSEFFVKAGMLVTGVDASDVFIREARKRVPKAKFIQGNLLEVKFPQNSFDGIWAQAVLLHLKRKDVPTAIKKFFKYLKPGGLLHVRVKKGKGERFEKEKLSGWNDRFYTYFSKKELEGYLKKEGFKIVSSGVYPDLIKTRKHVKWICFWAQKPKLKK